MIDKRMVKEKGGSDHGMGGATKKHRPRKAGMMQGADVSMKRATGGLSEKEIADGYRREKCSNRVYSHGSDY